MKLEKWMQITKIKKKSLAKQLGITTSSLYHYTTGKRAPTLEISCKIEVITEGKVTPQDLLDTWKEKNS